MPILQKYVIKEILIYFAMVLVSVVGIYLLIDFFEKIDNFMEAGLSIDRILTYFSLKIPLIVVQIMPIGVLLSVVIAFGLMAKHNELIALQTSGLSVTYLFKSIFMFGLAATLLMIFIAEIVLPISMSNANRIMYNEVKKQNITTSQDQDIWIKGNKSIIHVGYFDVFKQNAFDLTVCLFDDNFHLIRRIDAKKAVFDKTWILYDVSDQQNISNDDSYEVIYTDKIMYPLEIQPEDIVRVAKKSDEMNFLELLDYILKIENEGYDATRYRVDLYAKTSFPFVCVLMCVIGLLISLKITPRKDHLSKNIVLGVMIAFSYWVLFSFCISLGYASTLRPIYAAWLTDFLFIGLCAVLLYRRGVSS